MLAFLSLSGEFIRKFENGKKRRNKGLEALLGDVAESKNSEKPQKNVKKKLKKNHQKSY